MEDPVAEITPIILALTTSSADLQHQTIQRYFLPDAVFDHPLCAVDQFLFPVASRDVILGVYRWYKNLSPVIEIRVDSIAFDEPNGFLYVNMEQFFTFWFFPIPRIRAHLVSVIHLEKHRQRDGPESSGSDDGWITSDDEMFEDRWFIKSQKDLYQFEEWAGFFPVIGYPLRLTIVFWKRVAALVCWAFSVVIVAVFGFLFGGKLKGKGREDVGQQRVVHGERWVLERLRGERVGHGKGVGVRP